MLIIRKRLLLDTDPQELARVKLVLDKHGIEYEVKTTVSDNALSRQFNAAAAATVARKPSVPCWAARVSSCATV